MRRSVLIITALAFATSAWTQAYAADLQTSPTLSSRKSFAGRRLVDSFYRGDILTVTGGSRDGNKQDARSLSLAGEVYSSLGMYRKAADSYRSVLLSGTVDPDYYNRSLAGYMKIMRFVPGLAPPPVGDSPAGSISGKAALYYGTYLVQKGLVERGKTILSQAGAPDTDSGAFFALSSAGYEASRGDYTRSMAALRSFKTHDASPAVDLINLRKGYHLMESGQYTEARRAFTAIPPHSPFSPEAMFGLSWSMIRNKDLVGAAIRLKELLARHYDSDVARKAVIDLALCYRELGLYNSAAELLSEELNYLKQYRRWAEALQPSDLAAGKKLDTILKNILAGSPPGAGLAGSTPGFERQWILGAAADPGIKRLYSMSEGASSLMDAADALAAKYARAIWLMEEEAQHAKDVQTLISLQSRDLNTILRRLPMLLDNLISMLEVTPLAEFADEPALSLAGRVSRLRKRLDILDTSADRAGSFTSVINEINASKPKTSRELQLNIIRKNAYTGLIRAKKEVAQIKGAADSLEGKIWLMVKKEVAGVYTDINMRMDRDVNSARSTINQTLRAREIIESTEHSALVKAEELKRTLLIIKTRFPEQLESFRKRIQEQKAISLMSLARKTAAKLRTAEAKTLYAAADVETSHVESTIRAMREALN